MIIGVRGNIFSGKDTVGKAIQFLTSEAFRMGRSFEEFQRGSSNVDAFGSYYHSDWEIKKFAYKLKQIASILTGIPTNEFEKEEVKSSFLDSEWDKEGEKLSVRVLLQKLGTEAVRDIIHPNTWVNALFSEYKPISWTEGWVPSYNNPDNSGCDQPSEPIFPQWIITDLRFPNEYDAIKQRGGFNIQINRDVSKRSDHFSERALDNHKFDYYLDNNGPIDGLIRNVQLILRDRKIIL